MARDGAGSGVSALDAALLEAHAAGDRAALIRLYAQAAEAADDGEAAGFYLTHAYVFALEAGAPEAAALHARLKAEGREA
ncbi:hypothetical protein DRV85_03045 [Rhodosalinus halophilus]|uniref:Uncharacterized protein n=1 Tax=Rhodosalinus halophilus TaxID=2259333 RepID=A0A365UCG9_9RHOB|nr:hypothetical protein [Rhodosalinus halophilus]RBI87117.1 hypothetical protein DRV85_03045 [Rhodosalinus halophilus]